MGSTWSRDDLDVNDVSIVTVQDAISAFEWVVRHYYSWDATTRIAKSEILDLRLSAWCQTHPGEFVKKLSDRGLILRWMETPVIMPEAKKNDVEYVSNLFLMCFPSIPRKGTNVFPQLTKLHNAITLSGFIEILLHLAKEHRGYSFRGDILQWIRIVREMGVEVFEQPPLKGALPPEAKARCRIFGFSPPDSLYSTCHLNSERIIYLFHHISDSLLYIASKVPLPDILPSETTILELSTQRVADILCLYTLESIDQIHQRLRPGIETSVGFLSAHQWLAPTIIHDARRLRELNVDRDRISRALELFAMFHEVQASQHLKEEDADRFKKIEDRYLELKQEAGFDPEEKFFVHAIEGRHVADPFHPTYDNPTVHADRVYWVIAKENLPANPPPGPILPEQHWPQEKYIRFTKLHPVLIRRACFFEGPGTKYRLDPEKCIRILGIQNS